MRAAVDDPRHRRFALAYAVGSLVAQALWVAGALRGGPFAVDGAVLPLVAAGLAIAFALWWSYFASLGPGALERNRRAAFAWGYGHYDAPMLRQAVGAPLSRRRDRSRAT